jgi:protein dithiol oxidoreductase (disulfide-forming)
MRRIKLLLASFLFAGLAGAAERYTALDTPQPTVEPGRIEVRELFAYFCPHCNDLEPAITAWRDRQAGDVMFVRQPAVFDARWEPQARAYFVIEALELGEDVHRALFAAIHQQHRPLATREALAAFFAEQGVKADDFAAAYDSPGVEFKLREARERTRAYRVNGVPSLVVNGRYVTSMSQAGGEQGLLAVLDALVARERGAGGS